MQFALVELYPLFLAPGEQEAVIQAIQQAGPYSQVADNTWLLATPFPIQMVEEVVTRLVNQQHGIFFAALDPTPTLLNLEWKGGKAA